MGMCNVLDLGDEGLVENRCVRSRPVCLVGKLCSTKQFNTYALIEVMRKTFKPKGRLSARDWGNGLIVFSFELSGDWEWGHEQPSVVHLTSAAFWARVCDVPLINQSENSFRSIARRVGMLLCSEKLSGIEALPFLHFKVMVDLERPLVRGASSVLFRMWYRGTHGSELPIIRQGRKYECVARQSLFDSPLFVAYVVSLKSISTVTPSSSIGNIGSTPNLSTVPELSLNPGPIIVTPSLQVICPTRISLTETPSSLFAISHHTLLVSHPSQNVTTETLTSYIDLTTQRQRIPVPSSHILSITIHASVTVSDLSDVCELSSVIHHSLSLSPAVMNSTAYPAGGPGPFEGQSARGDDIVCEGLMLHGPVVAGKRPASLVEIDEDLEVGKEAKRVRGESIMVLADTTTISTTTTTSRGSPSEHNEVLRLELLGAWEPLESSCAEERNYFGRSQFRFPM
ncbi:hypothetical protein ACS0TY_021781 [Phlomoides rotata]